jgi:hypothetical protein
MVLIIVFIVIVIITMKTSLVTLPLIVFILASSL